MKRCVSGIPKYHPTTADKISSSVANNNEIDETLELPCNWMPTGPSESACMIVVKPTDDLWKIVLDDGTAIIDQNDAKELAKRCAYFRKAMGVDHNNSLFRESIEKQIIWRDIDKWSAQLLLTLIRGFKVPLNFLWHSGNMDDCINDDIRLSKETAMERVKHITAQMKERGKMIFAEPFFPSVANPLANVLNRFGLRATRSQKWLRIAELWWDVLHYSNPKYNGISVPDDSDDLSVSSIQLEFNSYLEKRVQGHREVSGMFLDRLFEKLHNERMMLVHCSCVGENRPCLGLFQPNPGENLSVSARDKSEPDSGYVVFTSYSIGAAAASLCRNIVTVCEQIWYDTKATPEIKVTMHGAIGTQEYLCTKHPICMKDPKIIETKVRPIIPSKLYGTSLPDQCIGLESFQWIGHNSSDHLAEIEGMVEKTLNRTPPNVKFGILLEKPDAALLEQFSAAVAKSKAKLFFRPYEDTFYVAEPPRTCLAILQNMQTVDENGESCKLQLTMEVL